MGIAKRIRGRRNSGLYEGKGPMKGTKEKTKTSTWSVMSADAIRDGSCGSSDEQPA